MYQERKRGDRAAWSAATLERAIAHLERALDPLFRERRYREFFRQAHDLRTAFRGASLTPAERSRLWDRLNRCTEAAKVRQAREFAGRHAANLTRWREQLARAEAYAAALSSEIAELAGRRGPPAELDRWRERIAEKQARLASVRTTIAELRRKIAEVSRGGDGRSAGP